jgi:hypothetical protein
MFGLFLVVDRRMAFWPASMESLRGVKAQFWPFLGFYIVATVLGSIGAVLCGIGAFLTWPITVCAMAVAYRESFGAPAESQPQAAPPPVAP